MRFWDKLRRFAVLRVAAGSLLPVLILAFMLAGAVVSSPAPASAMLSTSSDTLAGAAPGEPPLSVRIAAARVPDGPVQCFERPHPCGPDAIAAACAEPLFLGAAWRTRFVMPHAPVPVPVFDMAPRHPASLSILFRNFRK